MFTHIGDQSVQMVDISEKNITTRTAIAASTIEISDELTLELQKSFTNHKGPIFDTAVIAGIMAAKKTSDLIPMCHQIILSKVEVKYSFEKNKVSFQSYVKTEHKTGVEMEALTAVSVASLTFYDMVKSFGHKMTIKEIKLLEKTGGKTDYHSLNK
jgi:cyclic pyranopterin phosphate synthase